MNLAYALGGKKFCLSCKNELKPRVNFCTNCGVPIDGYQTQKMNVLQQKFIESYDQQSEKQVPKAMPVSTGQPLRVIAMQKKFTLVACLKDLLLPGNGFIYTEKMLEGDLVGLITIPLTIWSIIHYVQLWLSDVLSNLRFLGAYGYSPDYSISNGFLMPFLIISIIWLGIRFLWLWSSIQEHNRQIAKLADVNQMVAFVDGK